MRKRTRMKVTLVTMVKSKAAKHETRIIITGHQRDEWMWWQNMRERWTLNCVATNETRRAGKSAEAAVVERGGAVRKTKTHSAVKHFAVRCKNLRDSRKKKATMIYSKNKVFQSVTHGKYAKKMLEIGAPNIYTTKQKKSITILEQSIWKWYISFQKRHLYSNVVILQFSCISPGNSENKEWGPVSLDF